MNDQPVTLSLTDLNAWHFQYIVDMFNHYISATTTDELVIIIFNLQMLKST
jgi:hypothetical protein